MAGLRTLSSLSRRKPASRIATSMLSRKWPVYAYAFHACVTLCIAGLKVAQSKSLLLQMPEVLLVQVSGSVKLDSPSTMNERDSDEACRTLGFITQFIATLLPRPTSSKAAANRRTAASDDARW